LTLSAERRYRAAVRILPRRLLVLCTLLGACEDRPPQARVDPEAGGRLTFNLSLYCTEVSGAACYLADKCENQLLFFDRHRSHEDCMNALVEDCMVAGVRWDRAERAGALTFDAAAFYACLDEVGEASCNEAARAWGLLSCKTGVGGEPICDRFFFGMALSETCQGVFSGAIELDEPCYDDRECGEGLYCNEAYSVRCPGTCNRQLKRGDDCNNREEACGPGLICAGTSRERCMEPAREAEECSTLDSMHADRQPPTCEPPLVCLKGKGTAGSFGVCVPLVSRGGPCGDYRAECEPDSFCLHKSELSPEGFCEPFLAEGADCDDHLGFPRPCGNGLHCWGPGTDPGIPYIAGSKGVCKPYPTAGLPCVRNDSNCVDAYCTAGPPSFEGWCDPLGENGDDCSLNQQCASQLCGRDPDSRNMVCIPRPEDVTQQGCLRPEAPPEDGADAGR